MSFYLLVLCIIIVISILKVHLKYIWILIDITLVDFVLTCLWITHCFSTFLPLFIKPLERLYPKQNGEFLSIEIWAFIINLFQLKICPLTEPILINSFKGSLLSFPVLEHFPCIKFNFCSMSYFLVTLNLMSQWSSYLDHTCTCGL